MAFFCVKAPQVLVDPMLNEYNKTMIGIRTQIRYYLEYAGGVLNR